MVATIFVICNQNNYVNARDIHIGYLQDNTVVNLMSETINQYESNYTYYINCTVKLYKNGYTSYVDYYFRYDDGGSVVDFSTSLGARGRFGGTYGNPYPIAARIFNVAAGF